MKIEKGINIYTYTYETLINNVNINKSNVLKNNVCCRLVSIELTNSPDVTTDKTKLHSSAL
jgi:hypothetical protein